MIKSMTGYGSAKGKAEDLEISVELKSVNNRYLDCSVRLPRSFLFAEEMIKSQVQSSISRGKVDVFVSVDSSAADTMTVKVNEPLLKGYIQALDYMAQTFRLPQDMSVQSLSRFPEVLQVEKRDLDAEAITAAMAPVIGQALESFDRMRLREGEKLQEDLLARLQTMDRLVREIEQRSPETLLEYRRRLEQKMTEVLGSAGIDESRILTEAAIFADRIAVDEETVRLRSHMDQLRALILGESPIGRKLDFLVQECNREANTIGSKCQSAAVAHLVVELKAEIEKMREQIQNIE